MSIQQLSLIEWNGSGWEPAIDLPPIPIKHQTATQEAQKRFLDARPNADILNRHRRNTNGNPGIPYCYPDSEGDWLFYVAGKGGKTYLWNVYFKPKIPLNVKNQHRD
ncbi:MAG: hypothetical protein U7123_23335 [Potamolinea sp.]